MNRRHRLAHSEDFLRVRHQGRSWSDELLVLVAAQNDLPYSRFGFVVSKRIGKAVVRNRVRRLVREAVRVRLEGIAPGWDVVLIARTPIVPANWHRIGEALDSLLRRAGLTPDMGT